ncbi:hypothetical protein VPNG_05289 [Cytospora leucostoma]|uniref:Yeast cell wall synthesis Kre9/Knh1-like N-terminal domain-containing protein n=1 Tax=Cytospora leucostoma TaxID=1230097 RepID=A0A423X4Z4_9PEZI|nr:hypothetical protein VPNG_05289 [Cytospora leucostoma]
MRFTTSVAACMALIGRAFTQTDGFDAIINPTEDEVLDAGSTYQITWDYNDQYPGPISISLLQGASSSTLEVAETLATRADGIDSSIGSYSWTVGSELGDAATYAIKISLNSDPNIFQYSFPFEIAASGSGSSASTSTSTSTPPAVIVVSTATYSSLSAPSITAAPPSNFSSGYPGGYSGEYGPSNNSITSGAGAVTFSTHIATGGVNETATATGTTTAHRHAHVTKTTLTAIVSASSTGSATTKKAPSIAESGAGRAVAGVLVAMGGLAMALLVL